MLLMLIGLITSDQQCIVCHIAWATHSTTSIIHQAMLSKEKHPSLAMLFPHFPISLSMFLTPVSPPFLAVCADALYVFCYGLYLDLTYNLI